MKYRHLGNSGLTVSRVCLGTMTFGQEDWGCDAVTSKAVLNAFIDAGGTFIDTADAYAGGRSEQILGSLIAEHRREALVIATKGFFRQGPTSNDRGLSKKHILDACHASLRRLATDHIDLYQIHGPDPRTPLEETMRALEDLVRAGKVRYLGCSNLFAWQIMKANGIADRAGWTRFCSGQYLYNLITRDIEREILPACADQGVGVICWSPLAAGLLTGKYRKAPAPEEGTRMALRAKFDVKRFWHERGFRVAEEVSAVANEIGHTPHAVALAWLLGDRRISSVVVGARNPEQIRQNAAAGDLDLDPAIHRRLDDVAAFEPGYPTSWVLMNANPQFEDVDA